jgi:hypothetical protein
MRTTNLAIAPSFSLPDARGIVHTLDEFLRHGPALLAFHRGTF